MFFKSQMVFDDETISYIDCHEWFVFGGSNESGKKNDWIFHNAAINYILEFYANAMPHLQIWDLWTDNGPGQVSSKRLSDVMTETLITHIFYHHVFHHLLPLFTSVTV